MNAAPMTRTGRPSGTHTQAVRVLRLALDLVEPRTLESLARAHRVSERTIRRDLAALAQVYEIRMTAEIDRPMAYELGPIRTGRTNAAGAAGGAT